MQSSSRRTTIVSLIVACALFMENLDSTVLATALPVIAHSFNENPLHLSLAISFYLLSLAVFIPASGWVADRYGARRVFRMAIIVFAAGSLLCGISQNVPQLVLARVLQGMGGAMMVPVGRLVILRRVPKSELVGAMAYVTIPALVAPIIGPPIGGLIATYSSWRWIFLINIPIALVGYLFASIYIEETEPEHEREFDLRGWILLGAALAGLVFGFENLGKGILPWWIVALCMGCGALLLMIYVRHARRTPHPILDISMLRIPTFNAAVYGGSLFRVGVGATSLLMPLMLQEGFGLTPLESGLITFAGAIGAITMRTNVARLARRYGFRKLLVRNALIASVLVSACGFLTPHTPHVAILALVTVIGFTRSLQFTCISTMAFADVGNERMSQATSFAGTAQQLSLSVGVGTAAQALNSSMWLRGSQHLALADFSIAYWTIGFIAATAILVFMKLQAEAGSSVSGYRQAD